MLGFRRSGFRGYARRPQMTPSLLAIAAGLCLCCLSDMRLGNRVVGTQMSQSI
jgi:hypothetical protein